MSFVKVKGKTKYHSFVNKSIPIFQCQISEVRKNKSGEWEYDNYVLKTFNDLASYCNNLQEGSRLVAIGKLREEKWEDKSGQKRNRVVIIADEIGIISEVEKKAPINNDNDGLGEIPF